MDFHKYFLPNKNRSKIATFFTLHHYGLIQKNFNFQFVIVNFFYFFKKHLEIFYVV